MSDQSRTEYLVCYSTPHHEMREVFETPEWAIERAKKIDPPARVEKHTTTYTKEVIYP